LEGLYALEDYVAYHVLTCLIPAFLLAGAITVFLSCEAILKYLGSASKKSLSFPLAAVSSMGLAVCSCTVIPIAAGLYHRGGNIGPAFIILWTAPALGLLLAGPGLSAPNRIAIMRVFGIEKAAVYILTSIALATITAYVVGNIVWR